MRIYTLLIHVCCIFVGCLAGSAAIQPRWSDAFQLPSLTDGVPNPGVARPFSGEHQGVAVLAGGSNFGSKPLVEGGTKSYCAEIYTCVANSTQWIRAGVLPQPLAEGVSVSTPRGVVCVGGTDGKALSSGAFLLTVHAASRVAIESLPAFPFGFKMGAAAYYQDKVYVVANHAEQGSDVWLLDLDDLPRGWRALPALPVAREQPVAAVQNTAMQKTALFVFAGFSTNGLALTDGYAYDLAKGEKGLWQQLPSTTKTQAHFPVVGAQAIASGDQHILFLGGSHREVWNAHMQALATLHGEALRQHQQHYLKQPVEAFQFNREILGYHTVSDTWFVWGSQPFPGRCGMAVIPRKDGSLLLASGEIAPGIRTPDCAVMRFERVTSFHPFNLVIIVGYILGMAGIGLYFMRKTKSADDFFRGGGRLPWWAVSVSLYAAMFSSITFISIPALAYASDWRYYVLPIGIVALAPIVVRYYLPFFRRLNLTSAYEYLELRFNLACRLFASAAFILFMIVRVAIVAYLPAIAISAVTDIDVNVAIVVVILCTIAYCVSGGIEAVIWSDVIQTVAIAVGTCSVLGLLIAQTDGGVSGFFSVAIDHHKFRMFDFALDYQAPVFWVTLLGGLLVNMASYTSDQCVVQRYMTTADEAGAAKSIKLNSILSYVNCGVFFLIGTALYTYYASHPTRLDVTMPKNDSIFPIFIANELPVGMGGLILAAMAAATMSTLAANLNSSATAVTTDFYGRFFPGITERQRIACGRWMTVLFGFLGGMVALLLANMPVLSIYEQFQRYLGVLTGGLACLFFMGIFMRRVNGMGALCGLFANYVVCFWLNASDASWKPHLLLYGVLGMIACLIVARLSSPLFPASDKALAGLCWSERKKKDDVQR